MSLLAGNVELRGAWLHPHMFSTQQAADDSVELLRSTNLNAVFPLVFHGGGQAWYRTKLAPMAEEVESGFDPLGYLIEECHAHGIEVHAWYVNGSYGRTTPLHIFDKHPDWAVDARGSGTGRLWFDFGKMAVRKFQSDLMIECLTNYDVDGIHFDYIRYGPKLCYCDECQTTFAQRYGFDRITDEQSSQYPVASQFAANPVIEPTTAKVLARFHRGVPAIAINELGKGKVLLLNWRCMGLGPEPVRNTITQLLAKWDRGSGPAVMLSTKPTRRQYGLAGVLPVKVVLEGMGYQVSAVEEDHATRLDTRHLLVLAGEYKMPADVAAQIEQFVRNGGVAMFVDGPVFAMQHESVRRLLGMKRTGRFFSDAEVISAVRSNDVTPSRPSALTHAREEERARKWIEFRKSGVTELVRDVYHRAKKVKPEAMVTAAVFSRFDSLDGIMQDWPRWVREGIVDYVIPMAYTDNNEHLAERFAEWKTVDPTLRRVLPGLSNYRQLPEGKGVTTRNEDLCISQVQLSREQGAAGVLFFRAEYINEVLKRKLVEGPFREKARSYRIAP